MPGAPIGTGYREVNGQLVLFQWDIDGEEWDIPWNDDTYQEILDAVAERAVFPEEV